MRDITDLASKAATQHGLLTTRQLHEVGVTDTERRDLLAKGVLERVRRHVHRLAGAPLTWDQAVLALALTPGPHLALSHRCGLRLWSLRAIDEILEITVRYPANRRLSGVITHRSRDLVDADITWIDRIPVTSPVRTIADAGAVLPDHEVRRILDHAVATGLVTLADLWRFRIRVGRQGRNGVGPLHRALASLPTHAAHVESGPELALLRLLDEHGLPRPVPQHPVVAGGRRYRLDFAYPSARLALEYDGVEAHRSHDRFVDDRRRQNDLTLASWTVLRVTWDDLRHRPARLVQQIRAALEASSVSTSSVAASSASLRADRR